jgi:hypothetical protein
MDDEAQAFTLQLCEGVSFAERPQPYISFPVPKP